MKRREKVFQTQWTVPETPPDPQVELFWTYKAIELQRGWDAGTKEWRHLKQRSEDPHWKPLPED